MDCSTMKNHQSGSQTNWEFLPTTASMFKNKKEDHLLSNQQQGQQDIVSSLDDLLPSADVTVNQMQSNCIQKKSKADSISNMQKILSKFTLNELQTAVYKTVTEHSFSEKPQQLRMFVAGPGGTGKSWIIDALREFFHSQHEQRNDPTFSPMPKQTEKPISKKQNGPDRNVAESGLFDHRRSLHDWLQSHASNS